MAAGALPAAAPPVDFRGPRSTDSRWPPSPAFPSVIDDRRVGPDDVLGFENLPVEDEGVLAADLLANMTAATRTPSVAMTGCWFHVLAND